MLRHDAFVLEPLTADHLERDYQAVMASREMLRRWSGTSWPADDFTMTGNLEDLERHDGEHRRGEAYTYTVLTPDKATCLGCVYITQLASLAEANPGLDAGSHDAVVGFWTVSGDAGHGLDTELLDALQSWFDTAWAFDSVWYAVREDLVEQVSVLGAAGLTERHRVTVPNRSGHFILYR